ncbi:tRNA delta(2)-isopentenylpyrophosphate transferase [Candidatus Pelagibacter sp. IMCC9063]|uniref:tRNA (adenosine(37)-N6)-dimethylallyltransferase MiaA n=1 Tax=Pelagibacter sp. (strain IMCC9063) TaxID=1002672 RepID=UPI00020463D0|nr:tRNA (adenosine(37)-N6)-dimethylallyltransferase MiaA [Candidatus Pelagibacter sp. IMCC9063]AEA80479.1 tRNA delta(2)-isopentenylpyrophosphate transferase [Candidatus Pelagibacter sp. IMCC9063]
MHPKIILISGPTASGKSKLAIDVAKKFKGEVVNADSMQVYKEIKILSARPTDTKKIKHHLYGFVSVKKKFSTGHWLKLVDKKIQGILKKKKIPIIVGGTGLYFKSLINGMAKIPVISKTTREQVMKIHSKLGNHSFYKKLISLDPECKKYLKPSDPQRMIRAYEVFLKTKKSFYQWQKETKSKYAKEAFIKIALNPDRQYLHNEIIRRSIQIVNPKSILEVKKFSKLKVNKRLPANFIIGINEINDYLQNKITKEILHERVIVRTRQYAKRQFTWQRGQMQDWNRFEEVNYSKLLKKVSILLSKT